MTSDLIDPALLLAFLTLVATVTVLGFIRDRLVDPLNWLIRRYRRPPWHQVDRVATVRSRFTSQDGRPEARGTVFMSGALWTAHCDPRVAEHLQVGDRVEIEQLEGLVAKVKGKAA